MNESVKLSNESSEKEINLENVDLTNKNFRINSPISKRALFILGIDENTLYEISKEEYIDNNLELKNAPLDIQNKRYEIFNIRRLKSIEMAKKIRNEIIHDMAKKREKKYKSATDIFSKIDESVFLQNLPISTQQLKSRIDYEFKIQENLKKNHERHLEIEENLQRVKEEKKEEDEKKKREKEYLLEKVEQNQNDIYNKYLEKEEDEKKKKEERLERIELRKINELEELKRKQNEKNEKKMKVLENKEIIEQKRIEKINELKKRIETKNVIEINEVEPWKAEERGEKERQKIERKNFLREFNYRKKLEEYTKTKEKLLRMQEEREELLKKKAEEMSEKIREKEERSLLCMKINAENDDIKIKNIMDKNAYTDEKVKKRKKLNSLNLKKKFLYMNLKRNDTMNNLQILEKKREYERNKLILKMLDNDMKFIEMQNEKKKKKENLQSMNKQMIVKKINFIKKTKLALKSGKYRNSNELLTYVFNDNPEPPSYQYINKTDINK